MSDQTIDKSQLLESPAPWLDGLAICLLGKLGGLAKRDVKSWIAHSGGRVVAQSDPRVRLIVVGADSFPFNLRELDDETLQRVESGDVSLIEETEFWERCGLWEPEPTPGQLYTPAMLADLLKVPVRTIRRWHRLGLLSPVKEVCRLPYFDFEELAAARRLAGWLQTASAEQVEQKLVQLAKILPGVRRPLSQLPIIVEGNQVLLRQMSGLIEPNGQLRFDFDQWNLGEDVEVDAILSFPDPMGETPSRLTTERGAARTPPIDWSDFQLRSPEAGLQLAIAFEDQQDWHSAINVYRAMLLAFGPSSDVCFQLGELLYRQRVNGTPWRSNWMPSSWRPERTWAAF